MWIFIQQGQLIYFAMLLETYNKFEWIVTHKIYGYNCMYYLYTMKSIEWGWKHIKNISFQKCKEDTYQKKMKNEKLKRKRKRYAPFKFKGFAE